MPTHPARNRSRSAPIRAYLFGLVLMVALPAVGVIAWLVQSLAQQAALVAVSEVRASAADVVSRLDALLHQYDELLEELQENPAVRALDRKRCAQMLGANLMSHREVLQVAVYERSGSLVCGASQAGLPDALPLDAAGIEREIVHPDFHVGLLTRDTQLSRWVIPLTKPVYGDRGDAVGLVVARLDPLLLQLAMFLNSPAAGVVEVFDASGRVTLRSHDLDQWVGRLGGSTNSTLQSPQGESYVGAGANGSPWLFAPMEAAGYGIRVLAAVPERQALARSQRLVEGTVAAVALTLAVALALTAWLGGRIARPVRELAATSLRVAEGDTTARATPHGPAEVRELASRLNAMLDARASGEAVLRGSQELLQRALEASQLALWDLDLVRGEVYLSAGWSAMLGGPAEETRTSYEALAARVPAQEHARIRASMLASIKGKVQSYREEHRVRAYDGRHIWIVSTGRVVERSATGRALRMVGTNRDISERRLAQELAEGQKSVLETMASGAPLAASLEALVRMVQAQAGGGVVASILVLDSDGNRLCLGAAPDLPPALRAALDGLTVRPAAGACGVAVQERQPVVVEDVASDPRCAPVAALLLAHGLRACWSRPIIGASGAALGTFALYFREPGAPSERQRWLVEVLTQTASLAIQHDTARAALQRSVLTLERTFEHMDQGISITDAELRLVSCNKRFGQLLDLPENLCRAGVQAEAIFRFNAERGDDGPGDVAALVAQRMQVAHGMLAHRFERELPDGRVLEVRGQPLPDGGFVSTYSDITYRVNAERETKRFRAALNLSADAIYLIDAATLRVVDCNDGACRVLGYSRDELLGMSVGEFVAGQAVQRLRSELRERGSLAESHVQAIHKRKDGRQFPVEVNRGTHKTERGSFIVAVARDMSERVQADAARHSLQEQLRESQKMEAIGTLAGGIAHDFNNVLGAVLGNLELARGEIEPEHPARAHLEQIGRAGLRARALVQQILTFSRRQPQQLSVHTLAPLIEEALSLLRVILPAGVVLQVSLDIRPIHVLADPTQIQQVLMNLCTNAWQAMPSGQGRITVGLQLESDGSTAHLWVSDDGGGIEPERLERIFEPFFTTKPAGVGTGLGLSVVHGIVKAQGGEVRVDSVPGTGSTFHIDLPTVSAPAESPARPSGSRGAEAAMTTMGVAGASHCPVPPSPGQGLLGKHVVVVDDDEVLALVFEGLLSRAGCVVTRFTDARAAAAMLARPAVEVHLLVTDHDMPGMDGVVLAREAMSLRPGLPVVMASGLSGLGLLEKARSAGIGYVVAKENLHVELLPAVEQALSDKGWGELPG